MKTILLKILISGLILTTSSVFAVARNFSIPLTIVNKDCAPKNSHNHDMGFRVLAPIGQSGTVPGPFRCRSFTSNQGNSGGSVNRVVHVRKGLSLKIWIEQYWEDNTGCEQYMTLNPWKEEKDLIKSVFDGQKTPPSFSVNM